MPLPRKVIVPLQQHTGSPCLPLVKEGDTVAVGQKIGEAGGFVSVPVHAPISGTVTSVAPSLHPAMSTPVRSITIEAANTEQAPDAGWGMRSEWSAFSADEIRTLIKEAGIVGMGGAAFPTHVKLSPPAGKKIDSLIINGVECEPYLTADHRLMMEEPEGVIEGIRIILKVLGLSKAFLGIEMNKPDAIALMKERVSTLGAPVEVVPLKVKYPQGAEKQLIKAIVNREVPSGGLPFDVGTVVQNVGTTFAVYEAVALKKPLIERILTVSGDGIKEAKNLKVRIGTPFSEVIAYCGGVVEQASRGGGPGIRANGSPNRKVIMGGPMMGLAQYSLDVPVVKGTSGILVLAKEARTEEDGPCIKCGKCIEVCPMYLMPNRIADYAEKDNFSQAEAYGVKDCMECGACTFVCDVKRPIVHLVKYAKLNLAKKK